jgi:molecular chaperone DnaK
VVGVGAAIQAGVLGGEVKDVLLLDVTPLTLGVETLGGVLTSLIERNTTIPTRKGEIFSTAEDGQTAVDIHVLQGERPMAADNMTLGRFRLEGIPPAPRGIPQVEVTFDIDANGILNVSAQDKATGREQKITITASTNLSQQEVERMVEQAHRHEAEDQRRKDLVEARNVADSLAYQTEKTLGELGDKVTGTDRSAIQSKVDELRRAMEGDDTGRIRSVMQELQQASMKLGEQMYASAGPAGGPQPGGSYAGPTPPPPGGDGDVVEGEFREA